MNELHEDLLAELFRLEREAGLGQGAWRHTRRLKQQLRRDRITHLRSIHLDAGFVREAWEYLGRPPVLANLRCGVWYVPPDISSGECYFKSTDGHAGHWAFSLSRINLNIALAAATHGRAMVVDATRSGKRFPDALSKTVPIWCCVINRSVARYRAQQRPSASSTDGGDRPPGSHGEGGGGAHAARPSHLAQHRHSKSRPLTANARKPLLIGPALDPFGQQAAAAAATGAAAARVAARVPAAASTAAVVGAVRGTAPSGFRAGSRRPRRLRSSRCLGSAGAPTQVTDFSSYACFPFASAYPERQA